MLIREAMPNAVISTVTLAGVQVTFLIGGTVLVERIFSYEGIGNMAIDAMINRDLPLIQGLVLTFAVIFIALNLLDRPAQRLARPEAAAWLRRGARRAAPGGGSGSTRARRRRRLIVAALFLTALAAPLLAPHDPLAQDLLYTQLPPSWSPGGDPAYLFGTDSLGRDILSRLIYGARIAAFVAIVAASSPASSARSSASSPAIFRGIVDTIVSRLIDVWMSFPPVLLSIVLAAAVGAGLGSVMLAIVVIDWTRFARVVRSETQLQRQLDYVAAAARRRAHAAAARSSPRSCPTCCR